MVDCTHKKGTPHAQAYHFCLRHGRYKGRDQGRHRETQCPSLRCALRAGPVDKDRTTIAPTPPDCSSFRDRVRGGSWRGRGGRGRGRGRGGGNAGRPYYNGRNFSNYNNYNGGYIPRQYNNNGNGNNTNKNNSLPPPTQNGKNDKKKQSKNDK